MTQNSHLREDPSFNSVDTEHGDVPESEAAAAAARVPLGGPTLKRKKTCFKERKR